MSGAAEKHKSHANAAAKQSYGNRPQQDNRFAPLHPWRLMPEKKFPQQVDG